MGENSIKLFNINFDNLTLNDAVTKIEKKIIVNKKNNCYEFVVTPNVDHIVNVNKSKHFRKVYDNASLTLADGFPIILISKLLKTPLKEKVSGSDLTPLLFEMANKKKFRVFIFGSLPGVADKAMDKINREFGYILPFETYSPSFGFEKDNQKLNDAIKRIKQFQPDLLLVSLGSPKGEMFIYDHLNQLSVPLSIQVGASIDFLAGRIKRAPKWMQLYGFEWLYRLIKEPRRMFKRYLINDSYFLVLIIKEIFNINKNSGKSTSKKYIKK